MEVVQIDHFLLVCPFTYHFKMIFYITDQCLYIRFNKKVKSCLIKKFIWKIINAVRKSSEPKTSRFLLLVDPFIHDTPNRSIASFRLIHLFSSYLVLYLFSSFVIKRFLSFMLYEVLGTNELKKRFTPFFTNVHIYLNVCKHCVAITTKH